MVAGNSNHYLYTSRCEFHADGWLGLQVEFIAGKTGQKITFAYAGIPDKHNCKSDDKCDRTTWTTNTTDDSHTFK